MGEGERGGGVTLRYNTLIILLHFAVSFDRVVFCIYIFLNYVNFVANFITVAPIA